jgi:hypothetical protein
MTTESKKGRRSRMLSKKMNKSNQVVDFIKKPLFENEENCRIFKDLEAKAYHAINTKKIFTIVGGFDGIRQALIARGWIEKMLDVQVNKIVVDEKMIEKTVGSFDTTRIVLSHLCHVRHSPVYFIWQPKHFDLPLNINYPLKNRIMRTRTSDFTLKEMSIMKKQF